MSRRYPCVEYTEDFTCFGWHIRLWLSEPTGRPQEGTIVPQEIVSRIIKQIQSRPESTKTEIIDFVDQYIGREFVNAIQVKDINLVGSGIVAYLVDFADDVHG